MKSKFNKSRREFLKKSVSIGVGLYSTMHFGLSLSDAKDKSSKVVIARNEHVRNKSGEIVEDVLKNMLDSAIKGLTGKEQVKDAWNHYFDKGETVGIKINTLVGLRMTTHRELTYLIADSLANIGIKPENIIIWDKLDRDLISAGYEIKRKGKGYKCYGTNDDYSGLIIHRSIASRFSLILNQCSSLINVPVLKHHCLAGVTISLKNWFGAINNPNKYHDYNCDPFIADVNDVPILRNKQRLIICDALTAQYEYGPSYRRKYVWNFNGLLLATDPVALDYIGLRIIDDKRKENGLKPLLKTDCPPKHIATAADSEHKLGTNDPAKIDVLITVRSPRRVNTEAHGKYGGNK